MACIGLSVGLLAGCTLDIKSNSLIVVLCVHVMGRVPNTKVQVNHMVKTELRGKVGPTQQVTYVRDMPNDHARHKLYTAQWAINDKTEQCGGLSLTRRVSHDVIDTTCQQI